MRSFLSLAIALIVSVGLVAQSHNNMKEKSVREEITLTSDLRVGSTVLKPGVYEVVCDKTKISFTPMVETIDGPTLRIRAIKQRVSYPCTGLELSVKRETTELSTSTGKDGVRTLDKLYLRGSNVEHVFQ